MDIFGTIALILLAWKSRRLLVFLIFLNFIRLFIFARATRMGGMFSMEYIQILANKLYPKYGMKIPVVVKNIKDLRNDTGTYDISTSDHTGSHIVYIKLSERNPLRLLWGVCMDAFILYSLIGDIDKTKKENPEIFDMDNKYKMSFKEVLEILFLGEV